jgi:hypothetical protein
MSDLLERHWFGLRPNVEPIPALYWGGRAIFRNPDNIDILWDRQQFNNVDNKKNCEALWTWIQGKGLPRLRKELVAQGVSTRDDALVTVADRHGQLIANPRKSHGYLYLGAWRNETGRTPG